LDADDMVRAVEVDCSGRVSRGRLDIQASWCGFRVEAIARRGDFCVCVQFCFLSLRTIPVQWRGNSGIGGKTFRLFSDLHGLRRDVPAYSFYRRRGQSVHILFRVSYNRGFDTFTGAFRILFCNSRGRRDDSDNRRGEIRMVAASRFQFPG